jgi:hypothetical protein
MADTRCAGKGGALILRLINVTLLNWVPVLISSRCGYCDECDRAAGENIRRMEIH